MRKLSAFVCLVAALMLVCTACGPKCNKGKPCGETCIAKNKKCNK